MKKLKYAVILLLGLSMASTMMTSCTKDNDNSNNGGNGGGSYQTKIVGEWELIKRTHLVYDSIGGAFISEREFDVENYLHCKFTSEGVVTMDERWWRNIFMAYYDIEDNILKMRYADDTMEWTIKEMTNSKMVFEDESFRNGYSFPNEQGAYDYYDSSVRVVHRREFKKVN